MPRSRRNALWEYGAQWIANDPASPMLYRFWTEPGTGRTSRASLGTKDLEIAKRKLVEIVMKAAPKTSDTPLAAVLLKYFEERTDKRSSSKVARGHGRKALAFFGQAVRVRGLTEAKQRAFVDNCLQRGHKLSYVARIMATVSAAMIHSKLKEPEIIATEAKMIDKWGYSAVEPEKAYIPTDKECAELLLSRRMPEKLLRWCIIQSFNGGRPQTAIDLAPAQFNKDAGIVDLLPPGRAQIKKKYRPKVKAARTFRLLLRLWESKGLGAYGGKYCGYSTLEGAKSAIARLAKDTGIPVSTYSLRHKVTSILRKARTAEDQVSSVLGHKRPNLRTTAGYGDHDPNYQKEAADAMEAWFWRMVKMARNLEAERARNSQNTPDHAPTSRETYCLKR